MLVTNSSARGGGGSTLRVRCAVLLLEIEDRGGDLPTTREMLVGMEGEAAAAAISGCSSGCQSGWTTYLDDHSSYSCGSSRFNGKAQKPYCYCDYSEDAEDDLSMISDASSGPRQQYSTSNDDAAAAAAAAIHAIAAERRSRRMEAAARRQSKTATAASHLEDTASSPALLKYTNASADCNGYGGPASPAMEMGNAADFSCALSATTDFETPLNGIPMGSYRQMQYSTAPVKPMAATRRVEKKRR
ncbi:hypothetical protein GUJ93_ZPchr0013g34853 [Zizania palustris]|uniref:Uncharacterized protein n=1 Tax=Zizania palustris TaxID=103762 RepID=A0A8J5WYY1_ZIZPA|nr:hypothetical protein GUJ93_ZPchr0013g34853 [Zizania palustris]